MNETGRLERRSKHERPMPPRVDSDDSYDGDAVIFQMKLSKGPTIMVTATLPWKKPQPTAGDFAMQPYQRVG